MYQFQSQRFHIKEKQSLFFRAVHITAGKTPQDPPLVSIVFNDTYAYYGIYANYKQYEQGYYNTIRAQKYTGKTYERQRKGQ